MSAQNGKYLPRFDELISEGEMLWIKFQENKDGSLEDVVSFTKWTTSSLNLLDKLSISTNRFVTQFEIWIDNSPGRNINIGGALGVLQSARKEYSCGMAVEYHLSVSAAVFSGLLDEAEYLCNKGYLRASAVLIGAALEEGLKTRAKSDSIDINRKDTLNPITSKLKKKTVGILNEFEAKKLEVVAKIRNDAAHGDNFNYKKEDVEEALRTVESTLSKVLENA